MTTPIVVLDFETYYDTDYSLSRITTEEYIRSDRFEVIGVGVMLPEDDYPTWYSGQAPTNPGYRWSLDSVDEILRSIDWANTAALCHNGYFDHAILGWRYGIHPKILLDTMCMAQPHYGFTTGVSLAKLAEVLTLGQKGQEVVRALGKHRWNFTAQELAEYGAYCCNDTWLCKMIFDALLPLTPKRELLNIDETLRCYTDPRLHLDLELLKEHHQNIVDTKAIHYQWAANFLGCGPEDVKTIIMSNDKLAACLRELNVDPPQKLSPTTGKPAYAFAKTDDEFLALKEHEDEAVQTLVECRLGGKSTIAETRASRLIDVARRGTLPAYFKYYAAHPGRLGGGDAMNLQNLPRHKYKDGQLAERSMLRDAIMAPPDHILVAGDLSQIEARILCTIAGQEDIVEAFRQYDAGTGPDIYCVTATAYLGRVITKKDRNERQLGKVIRLALGYGMGLDKFVVTARREGVPLTKQQAEQAHKWFRDTSQYVTKFWRQCDTALKKLIAGEEYAFGVNGCIVVKVDGIHLPSGRVLRYPGLQEEGQDEYGRPQYSYLNRKKRVRIYGAKVAENICQSLAGSVCADAWLRLRGKLKVVLQIHDEIVVVCLKEQVEWAKETLMWAMTHPVPWLPQLPVAAAVGAAERYGEIEK